MYVYMFVCIYAGERRDAAKFVWGGAKELRDCLKYFWHALLSFVWLHKVSFSWDLYNIRCNPVFITSIVKRILVWLFYFKIRMLIFYLLLGWSDFWSETVWREEDVWDVSFTSYDASWRKPRWAWKDLVRTRELCDSSPSHSIYYQLN